MTRPAMDNAAARSERRRRRRKAGLCTECGADPVRGMRRCKHHQRANNTASQRGHARARVFQGEKL